MLLGPYGGQFTLIHSLFSQYKNSLVEIEKQNKKIELVDEKRRTFIQLERLGYILSEEHGKEEACTLLEASLGELFFLRSKFVAVGKFFS